MPNVIFWGSEQNAFIASAATSLIHVGRLVGNALSITSYIIFIVPLLLMLAEL
jgi:hypothetical protein